MSDPPDAERDLRADLEAPVEDQALAEHLLSNRPVPAPSFRAALGRRLWRPRRRLERRRVHALVAGYAVSGALLLLIAALSASGHGPL